MRTAAYKIIKAKRATYYGIGMSLARLSKAILGNEDSVHTVSTWLTGQYGESGLYVGNPSIIGADGVVRTLPLTLTDQELAKFHASCEVLRGMIGELTC